MAVNENKYKKINGKVKVKISCNAFLLIDCSGVFYNVYNCNLYNIYKVVIWPKNRYSYSNPLLYVHRV